MKAQHPAVVDQAVDHGRGHLVVAEGAAPQRELDVGRDHERLALVGLGHHLEEQLRPVRVEREDPQLVYDQHVRFEQTVELAVEPVLRFRAAQPCDKGGRGEEPRGTHRLAAQRAQRLRHVGLARPSVAHEHEVLAPVQERQRQQRFPAKPVRP